MRGRLYVAAIFAGVAAAAVLAVLLLGPGRFDPSPPSLSANPVPRIPGEVLFVDKDDCIIRARASGERRDQVTCAGRGVSNLSWLSATTAGYGSYNQGGMTWTELDLATGRTTLTDRSPRWEPPDPVSVKGDRLDFDRSGSVYRVSGSERVKIFDFDGPRNQQPSFVTWSPDGEWLLLQYRDKLWIVSRDGGVAGTLARTRGWSQDASWWIDGHGYLPRLTLTDAETPARPGR